MTCRKPLGLVMLLTASLTLLVGPNLDAQRVRKAQNLWNNDCASCHGSNGRNGSVQSILDDDWLIDGSDESLARIIKRGDANSGMPAFGHVYSDAEVRGLVIYIRELRRGINPLHQQVQRRPGSLNAQSKHHNFVIEEVLSGLDTPWGMAILPDGRWLINERRGTLRVVQNGKLHPRPVQGTPKVRAHGQGGLLDIVLHPNYADNGWIYLTYSGIKQIDGNALTLTKVVRGRIKGHRWADEQVIWEGQPKHHTWSGNHYGSRVTFDPQGYLYFTIGDRGRKAHAQDLDMPNGKVFRLHDDGRIPDDNPFVNTPGALPGIWSYGHRNPQGLDTHPVTGDIFDAEHGPRGGDEVNHVRKGLNYGWPVITYGMNYSGTPITDKTHAPGMEQPVTQWTPSIAVIGIDFYDGDAFPNWKNDLFVSAIASGNLRRLRIDLGPDGATLVEDELLFTDQGRLRDVYNAPDGLIYVLTSEGRVLRIRPS